MLLCSMWWSMFCIWPLGSFDLACGVREQEEFSTFPTCHGDRGCISGSSPVSGGTAVCHASATDEIAACFPPQHEDHPHWCQGILCPVGPSRCFQVVTGCNIAIVGLCWTIFSASCSKGTTMEVQGDVTQISAARDPWCIFKRVCSTSFSISNVCECCYLP